MKKEGHREKSLKLKKSLEKLLPDPEGINVEAITEISFGIAIHLIAYGMEHKYEEHLDTHTGLPKFLPSKGENKIAELFETLVTLRQGRWYGGKGNGDVVKECIRIIGEMEKWAGIYH